MANLAELHLLQRLQLRCETAIRMIDGVLQAEKELVEFSGVQTVHDISEVVRDALLVADLVRVEMEDRGADLRRVNVVLRLVMRCGEAAIAATRAISFVSLAQITRTSIASTGSREDENLVRDFTATASDFIGLVHTLVVEAKRYATFVAGVTDAAPAA